MRIAVAIFLVLTGCVAARPSDPVAEAVALRFEASETGAAVYFFRRQQFLGSLAPGSIIVDGQFIGQLALDDFLLVQLPPGRHDVVYHIGLTSGGGAIVVTSGEMAFFRLGIEASWTTNQIVIEPVARHEAIPIIEDLNFMPSAKYASKL